MASKTRDTAPPTPAPPPDPTTPVVPPPPIELPGDVALLLNQLDPVKLEALETIACGWLGAHPAGDPLGIIAALFDALGMAPDENTALAVRREMLTGFDQGWPPRVVLGWMTAIALRGGG